MPAYRNFTLRGDKSFADDLTVGQGAVSSRVALLLRSAEANPSLPRFVEKHSLPDGWLLGDAPRVPAERGGVAGGLSPWEWGSPPGLFPRAGAKVG